MNTRRPHGPGPLYYSHLSRHVQSELNTSENIVSNNIFSARIRHGYPAGRPGQAVAYLWVGRGSTDPPRNEKYNY